MQADLLLSTGGRRRLPTMPAFVLRHAASGCLVLLSGVAILLAWRRFAGGMQRPLDLSTASATSLFVAINAAAVMFPRPGSLRRDVATSCLSAVTAAALTLPGASWAASAVLWLPAIGCTAFTFFGSRVAAVARNATRPMSRPAGECSGAHGFPFDEHTSAVTRRFVDASGRDCLEAMLHARFAAGSRTAVLHLAFSPPFLETPEVCWSLKKSSGGDAAIDETAQVRATMVLPYGVRVELKLPAAPTTERVLPLQFTVVERASAGKS